MFARTLWRSKPLFARMNSCCAKNAWYSGCTASASTDPVPAVPLSLKHLIYDISCVCVSGCLSQLVPQQQCEWLKTTPRCMYKVVRRPLNILLMAAVNEASHSNWKCEASWWQEAESAKQQVVLQDPASTAENSRSNLTFSGWKVWKVHFKRNLRHLLTWLYIEESTPKHRVPAEPLHPASSNCRPAKRRVLTPPRARKTQYDFGGKFHPDLQRIGNTETEKGLACWR